MKKMRVICLLLAAILVAGLPIHALAEEKEQAISIDAGKAEKQKDGSYRFEKLQCSGGPVLGIQISFADQMHQGDALIAPEKLPDGIAANEALTSHAMLSFDVDPQKQAPRRFRRFYSRLHSPRGKKPRSFRSTLTFRVRSCIARSSISRPTIPIMRFSSRHAARCPCGTWIWRLSCRRKVFTRWCADTAKDWASLPSM